MMKKFMCLMLALMLSLSLFAGCSSTTLTSEELVLWEDAENVTTINEIWSQFVYNYKVSYPKAAVPKLKIVPHSEKSSIEDLTLHGPAGTGGDIVAFVNDTLGRAVGANLLDVNINADTIRSQHTAEAVSAVSHNGTMYGYPITSESQILIYKTNKISASQAQSVEDIIGNGAGQANAKLVWDVVEAYYGFGMFTDSVLYGASGNDGQNVDFATAQTKANITAVHAMKGNSNLIIPGLVDNGSTDVQGLASFLASGSQAADAIIVAPYFWAEAKREFGDGVAMAPLPTVNGNQMKPLSGYKMYGVSKNSRNPALAHMFASYLVNIESQAVRLKNKALLPTNIEVRQKIETATTENITVDMIRKPVGTQQQLKVTVPNAVVKEAQIFMDSLAVSRLMPAHSKFNAGIWSTYRSNFASIWAESSLDDAKLTAYLRNIEDAVKF